MGGVGGARSVHFVLSVVVRVKACTLLLKYVLEVLPRGGHDKGIGPVVRTMRVHVEHSEGDLHGGEWPPDSRLGQMSDLA